MRFIVRKFIEAPDLKTALRLEPKVKVLEIYMDNEVWKNRNFELKDSKNQKIGYADRR